MSTGNQHAGRASKSETGAVGLVFDRTQLPTPEQVRAKLVEIGFDAPNIDLLEGGQLWKISMRLGRVTTNGKDVSIVYFVTKALEELVPEMTPQDVGANIAAGRITVGILWPGAGTGRVSVGKDRVLVSWRS